MSSNIKRKKAYVDKNFCVACGVYCPMGTMTQGICLIKNK